MEAFVKRENEEEGSPRAELRAEVTARGSGEAPIRIKEEDDRCPPTAAAGAGGGTAGEDNPTVKEEDLHIIEVDFQTEGEVAQHLMVADGSSSSSVAVVEPGGGSWLSPGRGRMDSARVAEIEVVLEEDDDATGEADDDEDDAMPQSGLTKTARKGFVGTFGLRAPPLHRSTLRDDLWAHQGGDLRIYQSDLRGRQGDLWGRQGNLRIHQGDIQIHQGDLQIPQGDLRARWGDLRAPVSVPSRGRDAAGSRRSARIRRRRVVALPPRTLGRAPEMAGDERTDRRFNDDAATSGGGAEEEVKEEVKEEAEERVVTPSALRISDPEVALVFFLALVLRALLGAAEMRRRADHARTRRAAAAADAAVALRGGDVGGVGLDRLNEILGRRRAARRRILHYLFQHKRRASVWTHVRSSDWWEREASSFTDAQWLRSFGLSRDAFAGVCSALGPALQRRDTTFRLCVPVDKRVAMALWKLANGGGGGGGAGYKGAAQLFGVSVTTVWRCVQEFCSAVSQSPSAERLAQMTQGFCRR